MLKICSWNVNGIRAVLRKGALQEFLAKEQPDILCLQEIKAKPEQIETPEGYNIIVNSAQKPGYSGTAVLLRKELSLLSNLELYASENNSDDSFANLAVHEGRILTLDCGKFFLVDVYAPNSKPDLSRLTLREKEWDPEFLKYLKELEKEKPVVVCGDFNAAHEEIDLARPKTNHHSAGFTDEERQGITNYIQAGLVDTFRTLHPEEERYTWWSHWGKARENNIGWRIDYFFISESLRNKLESAEIYEHYLGSDHCPIAILLEV